MKTLKPKKMKKQDYKMIPLSDIVPDENQPRKNFAPEKLKTLSDSVKKYGIMTPLSVEKVGVKYILVDGERRFKVATQLKLKEVPAIVLEASTGIDRLVQQFHIQEQHENWTAAEKASVVYRLREELDVPLEQISEMLGLSKTTYNLYKSYSYIINKKEFERNNIGLEWAAGITAIKNQVKRISEETLKKPFDRTAESNLEKAMLNRIRSGDLMKPTQITQLKDSFTREPKSIAKFIESDVSSSQIFIDSDAKSAYHLRNIQASSSYVATHIRRYLENPDVIPTAFNISTVKNTIKACQEFISKVEN